MIIDTHSHLNFDAFKNDFDKVIRHSLESNIWMINIGSKYETSNRAVKIAENYSKGVYAAIGLHPIYAAADLVKIKTDVQEGGFRVEVEEFDSKEYKRLAASEKVVAIGEVGLDYYYKPKTKSKLEKFKEKQKKVFLEQLKTAEELNLPVVFHCRMAHNDLIKILEKEKNKIKGVIHCFTGTIKEMRKYLDLGFYIGFNGIIFKLNLDEAIRNCPLDKILVETDCPYLTPPQEGNKRNEPVFIKYVIRKIAKIKKKNYKEIEEITTLNAKKLFNLKLN